MGHTFFINVFFLISLQLNATAMKNVFTSGASAEDSSTSQSGTRAETVFGNTSSPSSPSSSTQGYDSTAVFGKTSGTSSSSNSGSRSAAVFGSKSGGQNREPGTETNSEQSNEQGNEATSGNSDQAKGDENPRSAPNYMWPVDGGRINSFYGWRSSRRFHDGIDIIAPSGTNVFASKSGEVIYSSNKIRGYGNMVVIRHNSGYSTVYAHNKTNLVKKGDIVKQGDIIAQVGSTGHSSGPHSHFEVRKGKYSVDPLKYLRTYDVKKHSGTYANSKDNPF